MKKLRNKLLLLLIFSTFSFLGLAQSTLSGNSTPYKQQETYIPWTLSNPGCSSCASFYWKVTRTWEYGAYRYDMWFSSNSAYANGQHCWTALSDIYIYVNNQLVYEEPAWLTFDGPYSNQATSFVTLIPNPVIKFTYIATTF